MAESAGEKTEEATPKRRLEARRKGTVAKSMDLTGAMGLLALVAVLPSALSMMGRGFMGGLTAGLQNLPKECSFEGARAFAWSVLQPSLGGIALLIATAMLVGVAANFAQVGFLVSGEAISPSLAKLNPMNGLKRLFSMRAGFEGAKAFAKSLIFGYLVWSSIQANWPTLMGLGYLPPIAALSATGGILKGIAMKIALVWLAMAALDYYFQRKQVDKQLRMTKDEVRREMKEQETSPELRAQMARRRRALSKNRVGDAVRNADVIVTNPTHYAVALKYDLGKSAAPEVVAKGVDFLAAKIRELAAEHRIPVVPNPPLARALYRQCEIGDQVPRELFQAVAEVLAYVYKTLKKKI